MPPKSLPAVLCSVYRVKKSTSTTKVYTDPVGKFSVQYPADWKLTATKDVKDASTASAEAKLTSPTGTVLELKSDWGGRGGMCEPEAGDKPFAAGNACASNEYLSSELLPIDNVYYPVDVERANGTTGTTYKKTDILLVTSHYAYIDGKSQYLIGLIDSNPQYTISLKDPDMGLIAPKHFLTVYDADGTFQPYIYATASGTTKEFLQSKDADTIKAILRTIKVDQ